MKKFLLLCLLIFMGFFFTGCAQADYIIIQKSDGSIEQIVSVALDKDSLHNAGIVEPVMISKLSTAIENEIEYIYNNNRNKFILTVSTDPTLTHTEKTQYLAGVTKDSRWLDDIFVLTIRFASVDIFNMYRRHQEVTNTGETKIDENFFTITMRQNLITVFGQPYKDSQQTLGEYYTNKYKDFIINNLFEHNTEAGQEAFNKLPPLTFAYSHVSNNSRMHSDADERHLTNFGTMHTWHIGSDNFEREITIYYTYAKTTAWYIAAIAATTVFLFVMFGFIVVKNKLKKT